MRPEERLTMGEQASAVRQPSTTCPQCKAHRFYTTNTWYKIGGMKRRLRKCWQCGYAENETVPEPIVEEAEGVGIDDEDNLTM